jgi:cell division protease FtsH
MESIEVVIAGYQRKNAVISEKDKLTVSYHEIGHALVAAKLKNASPVEKITIVPRTSGALGYTMQVDEEQHLLMTKEQILDKITTFCGGRAAEALVFNRITSGASNDIEQATKLARMMVTRLGMSDNFGMMALETQAGQYLSGDSQLICSDATSARIDMEIKEIIAECYKKAYQILDDNKEKLHELAKVLLDKETLTGMEFMAILAPNQLPPAEGDENAEPLPVVETSYEVKDAEDEAEDETADAEPETAAQTDGTETETSAPDYTVVTEETASDKPADDHNESAGL